MNTIENGYNFAVSKTAPQELDNERNTNYQFLQNYRLSDEEVFELISPTLQEFKDVSGMDCRKSLLFLCGLNLNSKNVWSSDLYNFSKALMIDNRLINDPFIRSKI